MPTVVYDSSSEMRFHPVAGFFTLLLGLVLAVWYIRDIGSTLMGDVRSFPAAFAETPVATLFFAILKTCAYLLFAFLFGLMMYISARNLFFRRVVTGLLVEVRSDGGNKFFLKINQRTLSVSGSPGLESALTETLTMKVEVRLTMGAFNRVIRLETIT